jgi:hypothetical protein
MIDKLKEDINTWVLDWVSVHNDKLGTVPCPFARQALLNNKIDYATVQDIVSLGSLIKLYAISGLSSEVLIIGMDRAAISAENLTSFTEYVNNSVLMPVGLVALEDHPDDEESINGVKMNQGTWALLLIQSIDKINQASEILKKQGYYDNWSQEEYDDVVSWRFLKD